MQNARSQATQGDYASAINTLHEILLFAPAEVAAWKLLARLQRKLGHIDAGIVSAKRALQLQNAQPGDRCAPISLTLAKLLWKQGEKADALEMLALLSAQEPDNAELQAIHELWEEGTST